ncbi:hypothetical protein [Streptomyces sp. MW-W600-10]|uniref:hypothetical protein n=1 Tax=Streptomyces sp. MW-W600-10 TaxID=2829819 RepID=UPI001C43C203|nr:hypothetical protein [Streptomyces sp. MW-W600-10]MBV7243534.1 hypothetical protein [Streptomyces sp. MW-W600-10]
MERPLPHLRSLGPSPVGRRKTGSEHRLICDGRGTSLKVITTAANVDDVTRTLALTDVIPPKGWASSATSSSRPSRSSTTSSASPSAGERRTELHDAFASPACSLIC